MQIVSQYNIDNLCNLYVPFPATVHLRNKNGKDSSKKKLALQRPAEVIVIVKMHFVHIYGLQTVGTPRVLGQTGT